MGLSGVRGRVYYVNSGCPTVNCADGFSAQPDGTETCWYDEVTRFTIADSVKKREYGHDKSEGWQDVVAGVRRVGVTIDAVLRPEAASTQLQAGRVMWLVLYPVGYGETTCGDPVEGYAMVDQVSYTYDLENGEPISYTATLSSKGPWTGFDSDSDPWGGFECACSGS